MCAVAGACRFGIYVCMHARMCAVAGACRFCSGGLQADALATPHAQRRLSPTPYALRPTPHALPPAPCPLPPDSNKEVKREHKLAIYDTEKEDWREVQLLDQNKDGTLWYVHWVDFNRRNDQWIESSRIDWQTSKERLKEVCV